MLILQGNFACYLHSIAVPSGKRETEIWERILKQILLGLHAHFPQQMCVLGAVYRGAF